jgi:hypothetical protein
MCIQTRTSKARDLREEEEEVEEEVDNNKN